jgi:hypothetical protein
LQLECNGNLSLSLLQHNQHWHFNKQGCEGGAASSKRISDHAYACLALLLYRAQEGSKMSGDSNRKFRHHPWSTVPAFLHRHGQYFGQKFAEM